MSCSGHWESRRRRAALIVAALIALSCGSSAGTLLRAQEQGAPSAEPSGLSALLALEDVLVDTIARSERSVVSIARVKLPPDDAFARRGEIADLLNAGRERSADFADDPTNPDFIPHEFGTGVVIDAEGLILTNAHVLGRRDAGEPDEKDVIWVTTIDRRPYRATVVGLDGRMDLAVLKIEASGLTPITFGDASTLRKGQIVISLGNPYTIARDGQVSAAWGMISNLARKAGPLQTGSESGAEQKPTLHHYGNLIQTDARLNLGTSGGPLLNLRGEMIGLTTAQAALEGFEQSAGYAIPVNDVFLRAVEALREGREMEYGFLGVGPTNLASHEIEQGKRGMRIASVLSGAPAAVGDGLQSADVILAVNGRPIYDQDGLMFEIGKMPVESTAELTVLRPRTGATQTIEVVLGKSPPHGLRIVTNPPPGWRGLRVDYVTVFADERRWGERATLEAGVAVIEVESQSAAWQAGLRSGMIVTTIAGTPVQSPREFFDALADRQDDVVVVMAAVRGGLAPHFLSEVSQPQRFTVLPTAE